MSGTLRLGLFDSVSLRDMAVLATVGFMKVEEFILLIQVVIFIFFTVFPYSQFWFYDLIRSSCLLYGIFSY